MTRLSYARLIVAVLAAGVAVSGCTTAVVKKKAAPEPVEVTKAGPPPHAPAHGYRYKHPDGVQLVYDSDLALYIATGYVDVYYSEGHYYRLYGGACETSVHVGGPWHKTESAKVPAGLKNKVSKAGKGHEKNKKS